MGYRTKRPGTRKLLTFGAGATLAIAQLGAGCVPAHDTSKMCRDQDSAVDGSGACVDGPVSDGGADAR